MDHQCLLRNHLCRLIPAVWTVVEVEQVWLYEWLALPSDMLIGLPGMIGIVSVPVAGS